jgi:hypothetical protein
MHLVFIAVVALHFVLSSDLAASQTLPSLAAKAGLLILSTRTKDYFPHIFQCSSK